MPRTAKTDLAFKHGSVRGRPKGSSKLSRLIETKTVADDDEDFVIESKIEIEPKNDIESIVSKLLDDRLKSYDENEKKTKAQIKAEKKKQKDLEKAEQKKQQDLEKEELKQHYELEITKYKNQVEELILKKGISDTTKQISEINKKRYQNLGGYYLN